MKSPNPSASPLSVANPTQAARPGLRVPDYASRTKYSPYSAGLRSAACLRGLHGIRYEQGDCTVLALQ